MHPWRKLHVQWITSERLRDISDEAFRLWVILVTVQDDAGGMGADTDVSTDTADSASSGMTFQEAQVAHLLLSMEASIGAWRAALSDGAISESRFDSKVRDVKRNTLAHLSRILPKEDARTRVESSAQVA